MRNISYFANIAKKLAKSRDLFKSYTVFKLKPYPGINLSLDLILRGRKWRFYSKIRFMPEFAFIVLCRAFILLSPKFKHIEVYFSTSRCLHFPAFSSRRLLLCKSCINGANYEIENNNRLPSLSSYIFMYICHIFIDDFTIQGERDR